MLRITGLFIDGGRVRNSEGPDPFRYATVDSEAPVFSWAADSEKGDNCQTACRAAVTSAEGEALWDSGWVQRAEQSLPYAGKRLPHGIPLRLRVTVRDRWGEESAPFEAEFVSGLLHTEEIRGKWITSPEETNGRVLYFRREVQISEMPLRACLMICGLGYHRASVNGKPVTQAKLEPAHSNYAKLVYYTVHPDALSLLRPGANVISAEVAEGWRHK